MEILIQCFGNSDKQLLLSLGLPMGKSLDLQESFWEYLRSYMNNGPWFDEQGKHSEPDEFIKSQLAIVGHRESLLKSSWKWVSKEYEVSHGKNFFDSSDLVLLLGGVVLGPSHAIQDFTCRIAKRRSRKLWPEIVAERLTPNGPTSRLVDLEQKQNPEQ